MGRDASSELPDDRAEEVEAIFVVADVDAICDELEDDGKGMESRNRSPDTQRMKFVLMAGAVGHDLLEEVNEQCLVSPRWMLTAGASDGEENQRPLTIRATRGRRPCLAEGLQQRHADPARVIGGRQRRSEHHGLCHLFVRDEARGAVSTAGIH